MAAAYIFSLGELVYDGHTIGHLTSVTVDDTDTIVPLPGNMRAPLKHAIGSGKMVISAKFSAFEPAVIATITNAVMTHTVSTDVALVWTLMMSDGNGKVITYPTVTITGIKLSAGLDKWLECDMTFEVASANETGNVRTVSETAGVTWAGGTGAKLAFSTGALTLQGTALGSLSGFNLDIAFQPVPLPSGYRYPFLVAQGGVKISGSSKFTAIDSAFFATKANALAAAPTSELSAIWTFTDTESTPVTHTITLPNVTLASVKTNASPDKWVETDISFEAAAAAGDSNLIEVT